MWSLDSVDMDIIQARAVCQLDKKTRSNGAIECRQWQEGWKKGREWLPATVPDSIWF
jgi:hypothetical protein